MQGAAFTRCGGPRAAVYIIHRKDRKRFKVGWAYDPLVRAQGLPEFQRSQLDLRSSLALWLPGRQRAQQVERAMHKSLAPYLAPAPHRGDGYSEWFAPASLPSAIQLLRQMPGDSPAGRSGPGLQPLLPELAAVIFSKDDRLPQNVWFDVEDLWLRIAAVLPMRVVDLGGSWQLWFMNFRHARDPEFTELRQRALDVDTFTWHLADERGEFVRLIAYEGDALVFTVTPISSIVRWPQGDDLGWQVKGLISRMRALRTEPIREVSS